MKSQNSATRTFSSLWYFLKNPILKKKSEIQLLVCVLSSSRVIISHHSSREERKKEEGQRNGRADGTGTLRRTHTEQAAAVPVLSTCGSQQAVKCRATAAASCWLLLLLLLLFSKKLVRDLEKILNKVLISFFTIIACKGVTFYILAFIQLDGTNIDLESIKCFLQECQLCGKR